MNSKILKTLGLEPGSTEQQAKNAYRRLSLKYHPDKNSDKEAVELYKRIKDAYNQIRKKPSILLGDRVQGTSKGRDISATIKVKCSQIFFGDSIAFEYKAQRGCTPCSGTGSKDSICKVCTTCNGTGELSSKFMRDLGQSGKCSECAGKGHLIEKEDRCPSCNGLSIKSLKCFTRVKLRPGMSDGQVITLPDKGGNGKWRGPRGHLYLKILVEDKDSSSISRDGKILTVKVPMTPAEFIVGKSVSVSTIDSGEIIGFLSSSVEPADIPYKNDKAIRFIPKIVWPKVSKRTDTLYKKILEVEKLPLKKDLFKEVK